MLFLVLSIGRQFQAALHILLQDFLYRDVMLVRDGDDDDD